MATYSPCHMFRLGTAHILLHGLVKDFWALWLQPKPKKKKGEALVEVTRLPDYIQKAISAQADSVLLTEFFGKPYTDIIMCGFDATYMK